MPPAATYTTYAATSKRALILHDSLAFLALLGSSVALFGVTLFLFQSFQAHRVDLARRWSERGRQALAHNQPEQAVAALRTALSYDPDGADARTDQLLLAQGLADAGHLDEANNYFLNLWDTRPGDGFVNLQLARLSRRKGEDREATDYYRAAIFGSWEGDGIVRRREARFELTDFLIQQHLNAEARNELFTIAGNAPMNPALNMTVADKLAEAGYLPDALSFYEKAAAADPHNPVPFERAGQAAYNLGDYPQAQKLLDRALEERAFRSEDSDTRSRIAALAENARRLQQLNLSRDQPARERADHIFAAARIAQARLKSCLAASNASGLTSLNARWTAAQAVAQAGGRRNALADAATEDTWTTLVYTTEQQTAAICGQPTGDDALLLRLANVAQPYTPPAPAALPLPTPDPNRPSFVRRIFGAKEAPVHGK
jgi:tetratricopeptide (TPR) repeat protein